MTNQSPSDIHESTTCALGPNGGPCELCAWANSSERREMLKTIDRAIDVTTAEYARVATVATVVAGILDVLDAGYQCGKGCDLKHPWMFPTEMFAGDDAPTGDDLRLRERFTDAVVAAITTLQAPPHNMDARLRAELAKRRKGEYDTTANC